MKAEELNGRLVLKTLKHEFDKTKDILDNNEFNYLTDFKVIVGDRDN